MSTAEQQKRLESSLKTRSGQFSAVTALSQRAVNRALGQLVVQFPEITTVRAELAGVSRLEATVGQPEVSFVTSDRNRSLVEYYCRLGSGTWENYVTGTTYDVKDWTIAFDVQIGQVVIDSNSDEDKRVRSVIQQPGDYSISSLFLTFNASSISRFNQESSDFNGVELTEDETLYLTIVLGRWYAGADSVMNDRQKRTIGYCLVTGKPETVNEDAPTFPPTSLKFQTYEYIAPGQNNPQQGIGKGDNNMLIYLQMTDHKPFPGDDLLEYSGNFVSSGMDGTVCLGREIFWDSYLLRNSAPRLLSTFNNYTYAWVAEWSITDIVACTWSIGMGDPNHVSDPSFYNWNAHPTIPLAWTWNPSRPEQIVRETYRNGNGWLKLDINCTTNNLMTANVGTNKVTISGKTNILVECESVGIFFPVAWQYNYTMHVWVSWSTDMTLKAVPGGGIEISLNLPDDPHQTFKVDSDPLKFTGGTGWTQMSGDQFEGVLEDLKASVGKIKLGEAAQALQNELNNSARFVVPGGGTFTYTNPMFNNNADLMIEASYLE